MDVVRYLADVVLLTVPVGILGGVLLATLGRLRLTDWVGYVGSVCMIFSRTSLHVERHGWLTVVPWVLGLAWAVHRAVRDVRRSRAGEEVVGAFMFGTPPAGVRNWLAMPGRTTSVFAFRRRSGGTTETPSPS